MAKKILIVDDSTDVKKILKNRLEANHYEAITASNGAEGLERVKSEKPDMVILDVMMPEMDGYTFVLELKKITEHKATPIIVLTAKEKLQDIFKIEGIQEYMIKPVDTTELLKKIEKYIGK